MNKPTATALYARISHDIEGAGAGVNRQLEDCRKLADSLGWAVGGEYVDNDVSAYSGKPRPEYERMLADLTDGLVDAVIVYHLDRLTRQPRDLEKFVDTVQAAGVTHVRFVGSDADIGTVDGLSMIRMLAIFASAESASKSRRITRKHQQNAAEGKPGNNSTRAFGYESDGITIRPDEAAVFRTVVARFLAGESANSLAAWLQDEEIPTVRNSGWRTSTLRGMLMNPKYAGLRALKGVVVGPGQWDAIITEDDHRRVLAMFAQRKVSGRRAPQRYLLSGLCRCSRCGNRLFSSARTNPNGTRTRRYVCVSGPDQGGCGRMTITAEPLERLLLDAVFFRLDTPALADTIAGRSSADVRVNELTTELDQAKEQLEELSAAYGNRQVTMSEWLTAKKPIQARAEAAQRQLATLTHTTALTGLVGNGQGLRDNWATMNLSRQVAVVKALVDHIVISPGAPASQVLDPARVGVVWLH
ncbi:recombinase family protein [Nocardioides salsibiostraticola]